MDVKKIIGKAIVFVGAFAGAKLAQKGVDTFINKPEQDDDYDDDFYEGTVPTDEEIEAIMQEREESTEEKTDD